jgi:hypothetical protein
MSNAGAWIPSVERIELKIESTRKLGKLVMLMSMGKHWRRRVLIVAVAGDVPL